MRAVALGGGHGLAATLTALRRLTDQLTAVVTVADDGGSSGRLRAAYPALLPPGDLRMALAALAGAEPAVTPDLLLLRDVLQWRFPPGADDPAAGGLAAHPVGNLLLAGLLADADDPVQALAVAGRLLGLPPGVRVLPMAAVPLEITAEVAAADGRADGGVVRGQVAVATTRGRVLAVELVPPAPPCPPETLAAIGAADLVVLGPGSLYTSLLPHLLVPELLDALVTTAARVVLVLNLVAQPGETDGFSLQTHLEVLAAHAPDLAVDVVLVDAAAAAAEPQPPGPAGGLDSRGLMSGPGIPGGRGLAAAAEDLGARLLVGPLARAAAPGEHDPALLAVALAGVAEAGGRDRPASVAARGRLGTRGTSG